jgi:hypothetical protein
VNNVHPEYVAGFVDGEGYIGITRIRRSDFTFGIEYRPVFRISNTNLKILEMLKEQFGGSIQCYPMNHQKNAKDIYVWTLQHGAVFDFLEIIGPFLIVKRQQFELLNELRTISRRRTGWPRTTATLQHQREQFYYRIRELNRKGKRREEASL